MINEIEILQGQITSDLDSLEKDVEAGLYPTERLNDYHEAMMNIKNKQINCWQLVAKNWMDKANEALKGGQKAIVLLKRLEALVEGKNPDEGSPENPLGGTAEPVDIEREKEMTS